jgi:hypothetical protein
LLRSCWSVSPLNGKYIYFMLRLILNSGILFIQSPLSNNIRLMSAELYELKTVFQGLQTLYQTYLPKVDPVLIHDLLVREKEKSEHSPFYMVEIFTKPGTDSEEMKNKIFERTGWLPTIYDSGTHYVTNQRLTLEKLKEISDSEDVIEVTGDYTGSIGGWGASHEATAQPHQ